MFVVGADVVSIPHYSVINNDTVFIEKECISFLKKTFSQIVIQM